MLKERIKEYWYELARFLCVVFCQSLFRIQVYGLQNVPTKGPFLLLSNHQSFIDPLFCGIRIPRPMCYMARDSLFTNWFFGRVLRSVDAIPIKQDQADISAIRKIIEKLKAGCGVCLFPEGTRSSDGKIAAIKPGVGFLSRRSNAPIVPVVIDGAFECWPRQRRIFSTGLITVCYGEPIPPAKIKNTDDNELARLLTAVLRKMQNECRARQGKKPYDYKSE